MKKRCFGGSRFVVAAAILTLFSLPLTGANAFYNNKSPLGTNTNEAMEDDSSVPFVDLFKLSLPFEEARPHLTKGEVHLDRYGWPRYIGPGGQAGTRFINKLPAGTIPDGNYTVLYSGQGKLTYGNDAVLVDSRPGRDVIRLTAGSDNIFRGTLFIKATNPRNPIRNIHILPPGGICSSNPFQRVNNPQQCARRDYLSFERHHAKILFNPDYLRFMRDFRVVRFMNMGGVTRNQLRSWKDRPHIQQSTWGGKEGRRGVPMEIMVELANRLHIDPWFNIHHKADDEYVRLFATYVNNNLNKDLKAYVEYSNETWNGLFRDQNQHMIRMGQRQHLDKNPQQAGFKYYAKRSVEIFNVWERAFGGTDRLVRVMGGLTSNTAMTATMLSFNDAYKHTDAFAIAPYVFGDTEVLKKVRSLAQVFDMMNNPKYRYSLPNVLKYVKNQAEITRRFGVDLVAYEGGQHLVDMSTGKNDHPRNQLFYRANRDPRMGQLYHRLLQGWKQAGGKMFVHFTSPRLYQKYGSKGIKEYITQPSANAPKYQAITSFINHNPCWWSGCNSSSIARHAKPPTRTALDLIRLAERVALTPLSPATDIPTLDVATGTAIPPVAINGRSGSVIPARPQQRPTPQKHLSGTKLPHTWDSRSPFVGASTHHLTNVIRGKIQNKKDLASLWQSSWDDRNLYIKVVVEDDRFVRDSQKPWDDDSIEIFIDADASMGQRYDGRNDYHFIFRLQDSRVAVGLNSPKGRTIPMQHRLRRTGNGYIMNLTVPWASLNIRPRVGHNIAMDVHVSDDDNGGARDGKLAWNAKKDESWRNPSTLKRITLDRATSVISSADR